MSLPGCVEIGLADKKRLEKLVVKEEKIRQIIDALNKQSLDPVDINDFLVEKGTSQIRQSTRAINIALRPQVKLMELLRFTGIMEDDHFKSKRDIEEIVEAAEIKIKYEGYIVREKQLADKIRRLENLKMPEDINYNELLSISTEGRQKLSRIKPASIGQASRISGVSPSDINILLMYLGR